MIQKKVSIIIPVYKTEPYIKECMDSVLSQDYPDLEILLVDDGSPDRCGEICDTYARTYPHVRVIHQLNQGLGMARNTGMAASRGDYLLFVDSDDCLDGRDAVSRLVKKAQEKRADIVVGGYRRFDDTFVSGVNSPHLKDDDNAETVDFRFKGFYQYGHLAYNWGKLYRKSFLTEHDLQCPSYPFTQDKAHNMTCYAYHPVYAFLEESIYLYRISEASVTFRYKERLMPVWIAIARDFRSFLKDRHLPAFYGDLLAVHIFFGIFFLVKQELSCQKHGILSSIRILKKYRQDPFVKRAVRALVKGKYVSRISSLSWKLVIWGASAAFYCRAYAPLVLGIALLRRLEIDRHITKSRYQN